MVNNKAEIYLFSLILSGELGGSCQQYLLFSKHLLDPGGNHRKCRNYIYISLFIKNNTIYNMDLIHLLQILFTHSSTKNALPVNFESFGNN